MNKHSFYMVNIKCIVISGLLLFAGGGYPQNNTNISDDLYGNWKFVKYFSWRATKYSLKEMHSIMDDTLIIQRDKIFFLHSKFIEPCVYTKMMYKDFFDRDDKEANFVEDRSLALKYTNKELSFLKRIETNCECNCLGIMYLKQDTLILNYCGGFSFFFLKMKPQKLKNEGHRL